MSPRPWPFSFLALLLAIVQIQGADIESIAFTTAAGYTDLRDCVEICFWDIESGGVIADLSCSDNYCIV